MANSFSSNVTRKLARVFLEAFEASRVITKTVDTQLLSGKFNPSSGSTADFKRPHDYTTTRTTGGDISSSKNDIISGKATGTVQKYFTVAAEWGNVEEALEMDQLDKILAPMATRIVTDLELDFATYMSNNCNLHYGTPGTVVDAWTDVAGAGALLNSMGVPSDKPWNYVMTPGTETALASAQSALASGKTGLVTNAWERAVISDNFAGMRVMCSNALPSRTNTTDADMAGALSATPTLTYLGAKDTMTQVWAVETFATSTEIKAGSIIQVTGKYRAGGGTRGAIFDSAGNQILYSGVVTEDVTLSSGAGNIVVAGAGIYESGGAYNTTTAALASGDVVTILGTTGDVVQPNLFYHPQAFGLGTVKLPKLYSTDTVATTEDGFSIRISKYADGDTNTQNVRFDLLPAYATFNPFFAGQGFGV